MKSYKNSFIVFLLVIICAFLDGCKRLHRPDVPACLHEKIQEFDGNYNCDEAKVDCFLFQGQYVYAFDPGVCAYADMQTEILNEHCETLGFLGGIMGNTEINGVSFFENAQFIETVWTK